MSGVIRCGCIGCLKGELHLEIDHKVRPVQLLPRRTPIPIKARVTTAIREMEQKGIIAKVTEPTPWNSNMVVTEKKDKLRICPTEITLPDAHRRRNTAGISKGLDILSIRCKRWLLASETGSSKQLSDHILATGRTIQVAENAICYKTSSRGISDETRRGTSGPERRERNCHAASRYAVQHPHLVVTWRYCFSFIRHTCLLSPITNHHSLL